MLAYIPVHTMRADSKHNEVTLHSSPMTPARFLRKHFLKRKENNARYSIRAFARDLGMSPALLSLVLNEKHHLTMKQATQVSVLLSLSQEESDALLRLTTLAHPPTSKGMRALQLQAKKSLISDKSTQKITTVEIEQFKLISQWYSFPILDLMTTSGFRNDPKWIAARLGISTVEVRDAIERLLSLGLCELSGRTLRKTHQKTQVKTSRSMSAVRSYHKQMIDKARSQLDLTHQTDFDSREISAITLAIPKAAFPELRKKIQAFQSELRSQFTQGDCDEIYQVNVQAFQLTKSSVEKV